MSKLPALVESVSTAIRSGCYGTDATAFMSVREFGRRHGVSLVTAHRAITALRRSGVLAGERGQRPRVRRRPPAGLLGQVHFGLLVSSHASPFFARLAAETRSALGEHGYGLLTGSTGHDAARERELVEGLLRAGVAGLGIAPGLGEESLALYRDLERRRVPVVFVGREIEDASADCVTVDNFAGGAAVAHHFVDQGYTSFGYITFGPRLKNDMRLAGFRSALGDHGLSLRHVVDDDGWDIPNGYNAMSKLMDLPDRPRAVMAFNDLPAIGALNYCREHGIAVPGGVAIAGFDNLPETRVTQPPLTTVEYPIPAMARRIVQALLDRLRAPENRLGIVQRLRPSLLVRNSTGGGCCLSSSASPAVGAYTGWL